MLLRSTLAALAVGLATTAAPASAGHLVVVNGCETIAPPSTSTTCVFVGLPGTYRVELAHDVRYAWAQVTCVNSRPQLYADAWDVDGYRASDQGRLDGGICTLVVAAGGVTANNPGNFGARGHVWLLP